MLTAYASCRHYSSSVDSRRCCRQRTRQTSPPPCPFSRHAAIFKCSITRRRAPPPKSASAFRQRRRITNQTDLPTPTSYDADAAAEKTAATALFIARQACHTIYNGTRCCQRSRAYSAPLSATAITPRCVSPGRRRPSRCGAGSRAKRACIARQPLLTSHINGAARHANGEE